ncbi:reticulocyte-binding protein homolog 2a-like [Biomphalaria glabrata]|uniref:Reticulocyte-binding protein homolog 2a-like n=1 Tax=Biomphalaria glabrata TaxID=6526 RepID=A0A9W2ZD67_BIOGL|nr:reticulocyte-binding protein homolog 2a-like [Biomphalaria glabrata]XP_055872968.1 reticulocyte-binding protein homolog 2a-like [Biomphalaria glabrata]
METRFSINSQFIADGQALGFTGADLQNYVKEQKEEYVKAEQARLDREERLKKEQRAEEHERWKEREVVEAKKRQEELELARLKEKIVEKELQKESKSENKEGEPKIQDKHRHIIDKLDKSFQNMKEDEDLIGFLTLFEAVATRCCIDKKSWAMLLSYKLTLKLKNFMLQDDLFKKENYDEVKVMLMRQADINGETCRKKFHQIRPKENDFRGYVADLKRALDNWMKMAEVKETIEGMKNMIVTNRLLESVSGEVYRQLILNKSDNVEDMLQVIESFKTASSTKSLCKEENVYVMGAAEATSQNYASDRKVITCFRCGKVGHRSTECYVGGAGVKPKQVTYNKDGTRHVSGTRNVSYGTYRRQFDTRGRRMDGGNWRGAYNDVNHGGGNNRRNYSGFDYTKEKNTDKSKKVQNTDRCIR